MSFFRIKDAFFTFFSKTTKRICAKFFSGFWRKRLFITIYIKKTLHPAFKIFDPSYHQSTYIQLRALNAEGEITWLDIELQFTLF